jgi:hypothetical protein
MVWNAANAPLREAEPQCCYPGCPACDDVMVPPDTCKQLGAVELHPAWYRHEQQGDDTSETVEVDYTVRYESGVIRGDNTGKTDYTLALDGPLFERWARLLTENVESKGKRNWMNASTREDYDRFRESFLRHALSVLRGDTDEDHHAACVFNLNGMLYTESRIDLDKDRC